MRDVSRTTSSRKLTRKNQQKQKNTKKGPKKKILQLIYKKSDTVAGIFSSRNEKFSVSAQEKETKATYDPLRATLPLNDPECEPLQEIYKKHVVHEQGWSQGFCDCCGRHEAKYGEMLLQLEKHIYASLT